MIPEQSMLYGMKVFIEPKVPRYVLPDDVPPPPGMTRQEFAEWSKRVCGFRESILNNQILKTPYGLHMSLETWHRVKEEFMRKPAWQPMESY